MPPLLECRHLTVYRDETRVLDDFSLTVPDGQGLAILGPNGSGKSTLIKLLTRELYPVDRPEALLRVLGRDRWVLSELREQMGVVSNDLMAACTRDVTALDLVVSGFFGSVGIWPHHEVRPHHTARAREALAGMDAAHLADRLVSRLSSGEARRALIARALVHRPRALVLDEPTNSLDLRAFADLRGLLRRLARQGISLMIVTHHLPDVIPEIERVVLLRGGRVFRDGAPADVLTGEALSSLFELPVTVTRRDGVWEASPE